MIDWIQNNIVGIVSIIIGGFIAYHVYFLSKKLDFKDKLTHKDSIRKLVEPILGRIANGISSKSELVNVHRYFAHYPHNNEYSRHGYTYLGAELKALRFDGVEFFCGVREVFSDDKGALSLEDGAGKKREDFNIFEVGVIPYEWIEYVDAHGDEFSYRPQFFTQFCGRKKSPYKYLVYYRISQTYQEGDPRDMKYSRVDLDN